MLIHVKKQEVAIAHNDSQIEIAILAEQETRNGWCASDIWF